MIQQYMDSSIEYADLKTTNVSQKYFDEYSNQVFFRRAIVSKEVPLLSCLEKDEKNKYKCTYKYGKGFAYYDSAAPEETGGNE